MDPIRASKWLTFVLRHRPDEVGLRLEDGGWLDVDLLLEGSRNRGREIDRALLRSVVDSNDKNRFELSGDGLFIRARQGHTVPVSLGYEKTEPPDRLLHGTHVEVLHAIERWGIRKMQRHHVHMTESLDRAHRTGARRGVPIVLEIDSADMARRGHVFYRTGNGVWLTEFVPAACIVGVLR